MAAVALRARNAYKMNWDCNKGGAGRNCFNRKCRVKFAVFADCFPARINFSDVDGIAEIAGAFCLIEWKSVGASLKTSQILLFERITIDGRSIVFAVEGDAERMTVARFCRFSNGSQGSWQVGNLRSLKREIRSWAIWQRAFKQNAFKGDRR